MKKSNRTGKHRQQAFKAGNGRLPGTGLFSGLTAYRSAILLAAGSLFGLAASGQAQDQSGTPATPAANAPATPATADTLTAPPLSVASGVAHQKVLKNELGISADFMLASGTVNLPIGYSLSGLTKQVDSAKRSTEYFGGTVSYSYGRSWYLDLSYEHGVSTGSQDLPIQNTIGNLTANFNYTDDWYQLYLRHEFKALKGTPFKAYMRLGASLVNATLTASDANIYSQNDDTTDILGNIGLGLKYSLHSTLRFKIGLQGEAEGFYGFRTQNSTETLPLDHGYQPQSATINNNLYGFIGRGTVHAEWLVGQTGRVKFFTDVGVEYKNTTVSYTGNKAPDEYLFGPYVKLGLSYVF